MILALLSGLAFADPEDALGPVTRQMYAEARQREAAGDLAHASALYRAVWGNEPNFPQALIDLAEVLELQGDVDGAIAALEEAPYDADAVEALGRLLLRRDRPEDAALQFRRLQDLAPESPIGRMLEATALARFDAVGAHDVALLVLRSGLLLPLDGDAQRLVEEVAAAHRARKDAAREQALLRAAQEKWPDELGVVQPSWFRDLALRAEIEDLARKLASARPDPLDPAQDAQLQAARAAFAKGDWSTARGQLLALAKQAPRNPDVWAALADVYEESGDPAAAEQALQRAKAYDPLDPAHPGRLGQLLACAYERDRPFSIQLDSGETIEVRRPCWYGGRQEAQAAREIELSLLLDPNQAELWALLAQVERTRTDEELAADMGAWRRSRAGGEVAWRLQMYDLDRERPPVPGDLPAPGALEPYWIAEAWYQKHNPARAAEEVARALEAKPDDVRALNLQARLALEAGDEARATRAWEKSLAIDPSQADVRARLGEIAWPERPLEAVRLWEEAAASGSADARFLLAREAAADGRLYDARDLLDAYFAGATSGDHHDEALSLLRDVERDLGRRWFLGGLGTLTVAVVPAFLWRRRRAGVDLEAVLLASPTSWRDVARTCSVIRHEVLKHNTTTLPAVADALERGDAEPARWAHERLFGPRGAIERFRERTADLETLARLHGLRLNLVHRDRTLGPVVRAMDDLARLERDLRKGNRRIAGELRALGKALNEDGYRALGVLVRRLCLLPLDEGLIDGIWARTAAEFPGHGVALDVSLDERPWLRISRGDLEDILANVLRNGLQAAVEAGTKRMAVVVASEEDEITGLERVAIRVCDDAPKRISTAIVRGRYIERGLGLTVDLISRNGGSIHVEDEPGWSKAVVVRLPRAEALVAMVEEEP